MSNYLNLIDVRVGNSPRFIDSSLFAKVIANNKNTVILIKTFGDKWVKIEVDRRAGVRVKTGYDGPFSSGITNDEMSYARIDTNLLRDFREVTGNTSIADVYTFPYSKLRKADDE